MIKLIITITLCIIAFISTLVFLNVYYTNNTFVLPENEILSPDDYCISRGWDRSDGFNEEGYLKCLKERNGEVGRLPDAKNTLSGYMMYQYPPKTILETYCELTK